jgi:pyruvate dehydrogenase E1 component alpha subunit
LFFSLLLFSFLSSLGVSYRTREEIEGVRAQRDCIEQMRQRMIKSNLATEEELKAIEKEVKKQVDEDIEFAKNAELPPLSEATADIYVEGPPPFIRFVEHPASLVSQKA